MYQYSGAERELLFILPTYGHFDYARNCLESFVRNTPHSIYYVAIIDDASPEWADQNFWRWPSCPKMFYRFLTRDGLTRSWNTGLKLAKDYDFKYAICGNSDLLFTEGWYEPLKRALENGFDLVGPVTNAPGHANWQSINNFCSFKPTDNRVYLDMTAKVMRGYYGNSAIPCHYINGFLMMARTATWWSGAFDHVHVFDPSKKLTGNEDELQARWRAKGKKIGFVPQSFVFHYRSVSRPEALRDRSSKGAYRHEGTCGNGRVQKNEHGQLVDACLAERGEVRGCQAGSGPQL